MWRLTIALLFVVVSSCGARAKCAGVLLRINGETKVHSPNQKIQVTITPDPDPSRPMVVMMGNRFEADVYYHALQPQGREAGDSCAQPPEKVSVSLLQDGKEIDKKEFIFSKDFAPHDDGGYFLRSELHLGN